VTSAEAAQPPRPKVSIVIPMFNALVYTQRCLESIQSSPTSIPFEIILVNNGSTDDTRNWIESYRKDRPNIRLISHETNLGFGAGVNTGIRESAGDYIVILNNDTVVTPQWLDRMLSVFPQDHEIGIVSPLTNYTIKGHQLDTEAWNVQPEAASAYAESIQDQTGFLYEPFRLAFFCATLSRSMVDRIGLLDERYEFALFEDYDYCFRAIMAGYRLAVATNAFVFHQGSATLKANALPYTDLLEQNQGKFYARVDELTSSTLRSSFTEKKNKTIETSMVLRVADHPLALRYALNCLANQIYQDFEVIIVNDSNQDVSKEIDTYRRYLDITYISSDPRLGRAHSLNMAVRQARGKWIGYLENGDFLYPWHLACLTSSLRENPKYKFAYSNYNTAVMREDVGSVPVKIQTTAAWEFDLNELMVRNFIPMHCWLHEKDCMVQAEYLDESMAPLAEYDFLLKCALDQELFHLDRITCEHRVYTSSNGSIDVKQVPDRLRIIYSRYPANDPQVEEKRQSIVRYMEGQAMEVESARAGVQGGDAQMISALHPGALP
jgi:GT2 family glycosyltransferase